MDRWRSEFLQLDFIQSMISTASLATHMSGGIIRRYFSIRRVLLRLFDIFMDYQAYEESQKYKEGKYIVEKALMRKTQIKAS